MLKDAYLNSGLNVITMTVSYAVLR